MPPLNNGGLLPCRNIPQDMIDKLRLWNQSDIELAGDFIELLVERNRKNHTSDTYVPL